MKKIFTVLFALAFISGTCTPAFAKNCDVTFASPLIAKPYPVGSNKNLVVVKVEFKLTDTDSKTRTIIIDQKHKTRIISLDNCRVKSLIAIAYAMDKKTKQLVVFSKAKYCPGNPCNPLFRTQHTVNYLYPLPFNGFWHPLKTN